MNIIDAIINLIENPITELTDVRNGNNRANNAGDGLEIYVKNLFAGTFDYTDMRMRDRIWDDVFSYLGSASKPPDMMLRGGDAIEVKKIEAPTSALALNSSYPKKRLYATSQSISIACKQAERWGVKDMIYVVGLVRKNTTRLLRLCMVYGLDYCAGAEVYEYLKQLIKKGVETADGVEFQETTELGHINNIDPLGITYMRVRPMYGIQNPWVVFNYYLQFRRRAGFDFFAIIDDEKWDGFDNTDDLLALTELHDDLIIVHDDIPDPDDPEETRGVVIITYVSD